MNYDHTFFRCLIILVICNLLGCKSLPDKSYENTIETHQINNYNILLKKYNDISTSKLQNISTINRNILGLKLRSKVSNIIDSLKEYKPAIEIEKEYSNFDFPGANKFLKSIKAEIDNEHFEISFLPPPNASISSLIKRRVLFNKDSLLELQLVTSRIREIYGLPLAELRRNNRYTLIWLSNHFLSEIHIASIDICKNFQDGMKVYQKHANSKDLFLSRRKENPAIIGKSARKAAAYGCGDALIIDLFYHKDKINLVHEIEYYYLNSNTLIKSFELSNAFVEELIRTNKQTEINILRENRNKPTVKF